jgi:hypothetical protein
MEIPWDKVEKLPIPSLMFSVFEKFPGRFTYNGVSNVIYYNDETLRFGYDVDRNNTWGSFSGEIPGDSFNQKIVSHLTQLLED